MEKLENEEITEIIQLNLTITELRVLVRIGAIGVSMLYDDAESALAYVNSTLANPERFPAIANRKIAEKLVALTTKLKETGKI